MSASECTQKTPFFLCEDLLQESTSDSVRAIPEVVNCPQASSRLKVFIFTNNFFIYFWQRGKPGQGVPLNGSNLEKWIEPGFLMAAKSYRESKLD